MTPTNPQESANDPKKTDPKNREEARLDRKLKEKKARRRRELSVPTFVYDEELPVSARREEIKKAIAENQVVILCGETGSGKSTQLPKICMELGFGVRRLIGHTQPRRIAAISIANRLAHELSQGTQRPVLPSENAHLKEGEAPVELIPPEKLVGYKIRFTDHTSPETCIKLMTDGILLAETQGDRFLNQYEVLIIDEAHERSLNIDFLIGILRRLADRRPDLKIIITSATIDAARFAAHFETGSRKVPILMVEGRTYPVEVIYQPIFEDEDEEADDELDAVQNSGQKPKKNREKDSAPRVVHDGDVHQAVIRAAEFLAQKGPGDMLVFMPTERDIHELVKLFAGEEKRQKLHLFRHENVEVLPLYARLPAEQQQKIFNPTGNKRRIVIATNVAESSVTVPRIRYVIDSGTARISRYSARSKTQRLPIEPISRASADQRKGRCGRIGPGICVRLYSEEDFNSREEYTQPEIQRTNLASVILQTKILKLGRVESFPFLDMPKLASIRDGYKTLFELKALTKATPDGDLTPLGMKLARIPVDPRIGRIVLEAIELAKRSTRKDGAPAVAGPVAKSGNRSALRKSPDSRKTGPLTSNPLLEILVIAAALEIRDPRERPIEKQGAADAAHEQFLDSKSDFISFLKLWDFYAQLKEKLSRNQLLKACRQNFISWNRMREWFDVYQQLRELVQQILKEEKLPEKLLHGDTSQLTPGAAPGTKPEQIQAKYEAIHRALLSGLLSNVGQKTPLTPEYAVGGGGKCWLWPGSGVLRQVPEQKPAQDPGQKAGKAPENEKEFSKEIPKEIHREKAGAKFWGRTLDAQGRIIDTHGNVDPETNSSAPADAGVGSVLDAADEKKPKKKTFPEWVMAAEMVETSKRFLRTNAVIDVEWIEPLAEHLIQKSHSEPHWSKQNNDVMIYEKVTLFGLTIVPKRRVPYAQVDQARAREMFIQQGLAEGNFQSKIDFYAWNRALWFELEQTQAKLRRFDYLPGTWKLYEFYDQRLPKTVFDHATLEKWAKTADPETLKSLEMREEDLVSEKPDASLSEQFPDSFSGVFTYSSKPVVMKQGAKAGNSSEKISSETSKDSAPTQETAEETPLREIRLFGQVVQPVLKTKKPAPPKTPPKPTAAPPVSRVPDAKPPVPEKAPRDEKAQNAEMTSSYQFPLEYRFEPGSDADGVTIHATLETVHQLQESALEWGVPGLLAERVAHLIKALPKEQRRKLIPAPDTAREVCARIPFGVGNLRNVLAAEFTRIAGELIREKDLDFSQIPPALQMNIRVSDSQGNILVESRNLREVLEKVGDQASEKFAMVKDSKWTRSGFTSWSFGDLPVQVQIESTLLDAASRAGKISAFPMLVDEGKTVGIRLSTSQFQAEMNTRRAVIRLFRIAANRELNQQAVWMPGFTEMKMQADYFVKTTKTPFVDTICDLIAHTALEPEGFPALADLKSLLNRVPRNREEFELIVKLAKKRISIVVQELPKPLEQLWKSYHAAIKALNGLCAKGSQRHAVNDLASRLTIGTLQIKSFGNLKSGPQNAKEEKSEKTSETPSRVALYEPFQPIVDDLDAQIRRLTPPDFLLRTPWKYVKHFARYFRGIEARIQALSGTNSGTRIALSRGLEQMQELAYFQEEYERLRRDFDLRGIESEALEAFRWAIEEYRISLFAQKLGTTMSVSAKRLEKMLEEI